MRLKTLSAGIGASTLLMMAAPISANADALAEALANGKTSGNLRLRYETVSQDNTAEDATALTLRTRLGYTSGAINGFSGTIEFEDNSIVADQSDYTVGPTGFNPGQYSVIADPEFTEIDQSFIQYKNDTVKAKLGRQVITMDNHRFVGHVGWRQDRQTFDALSFVYTPMDKLTINAAYINKRNRIFAEAADVKSKDTLLNVAYMTPAGKISVYSYMLETDGVANSAIDTFGVRFSGKQASGSMTYLYTAEVASQSNDSNDADTNYINLEGGIVASGMTFKLGYEVLGSDDGSGAFVTPLATLHKFNGWADQFLGTPSTGLNDISLTFSTKIAGGKFAAIYHDFSADDAGTASDDLGSEIDLLYVKPFAKKYKAGIKLAQYSAPDTGTRVDADKVWVWAEMAF